jgi:serine/threonine protein kinase
MGDSGWRIGGYVADELIGRGATGAVWRGHVRRTGAEVALKRIDTGPPGWRARAEAEAGLLSALEHPNLIRLLELRGDGEAVVLVLDLAAGGSLADLLQRRGRLSVGEATSVLPDIASALAYVHDEGVTHGDVSAANVLFTAQGRPMLADLGTARLLGDAERVTATLAYLDPTVAAGGIPGPPSDVFALAAVAFHALTGAPPWTEPGGSAGRTGPGNAPAEPQRLLDVIGRGEIPDLAKRLAGLPPAVADVLGRALDASPAERGSAAAFALDLRQAAPPVSVHLGAGRVGHIARHAALPAPESADVVPPALLTSEPPPRRRPPSMQSPYLDRPTFARPQPAAPAGRSAPAPAAGLTQAVRAAVRPIAPLHWASRPWRRRPWLGAQPRIGAGPTGRHDGPADRRYRAVGVAIAVLVGLGLLYGGWQFVAGRGTASRTPVAATSAAGPPTASSMAPSAASLTAARSTTSPAPSSASTTSVASSAAAVVGWAAVLNQLDERRQDAFARGDPNALTRVYVAGSLLQQDAAAMTQRVPTGCRIIGLRTSYSGVVLRVRTANLVLLTATARLASAAVVCGSSVREHTPVHGPVTMTLDLTPSGAEYRIAAIRLVGA